jgi:hypothetical protein
MRALPARRQRNELGALPLERAVQSGRKGETAAQLTRALAIEVEGLLLSL